MLPPRFESIAKTLLALYLSFISNDKIRKEVPDLLTAEEQVVRFVRELGLSMLQVFVDVRLEQADAADSRCGCGKPIGAHRRTTWTRKTLLGEIRVVDPYVYCRDCKQAGRPLHALLGTDRETWSLSVQEAAVDLASDESCGKAVAKLGRHHPGVAMDRTMALRLIHQHGKQAREFIDARLSRAAALAELPWGLRGNTAEEMEVEYDAGMIPVGTLEPLPVAEGDKPELTPVRGLKKRRRWCRWEEVKAGLIQIPGEIGRLYSLRPTSQLTQAFSDLFALACLKGWDEKTKTRGLADGARYIRMRMEEAFDVGDFKFILDRPHAKEHLSDAGVALQLSDDPSGQQWAGEALKKLEAGDAHLVVSELREAHLQLVGDASEKLSTADQERAERLRLEAGYFQWNSDAVAYAEYRENGWGTASSEIESGHRHLVQTRLKISGAWWHPDHVDDILALRMLKANGWWDDYWRHQRQLWTDRAQSFT